MLYVQLSRTNDLVGRDFKNQCKLYDLQTIVCRYWRARLMLYSANMWGTPIDWKWYITIGTCSTIGWRWMINSDRMYWDSLIYYLDSCFPSTPNNFYIYVQLLIQTLFAFAWTTNLLSNFYIFQFVKKVNIKNTKSCLYQTPGWLCSFRTFRSGIRSNNPVKGIKQY